MYRKSRTRNIVLLDLFGLCFFTKKAEVESSKYTCYNRNRIRIVFFGKDEEKHEQIGIHERLFHRPGGRLR